MLGPGNTDAAGESLAAWPGGLQVGGGINDTNAKEWIDAGAEKVCLSPCCWHIQLTNYLQVIITSFLFPNGTFSQPRLDSVLAALDGDKTKLVIDLSCRRHGGDDSWFVAMDKWQTITDMEVCEGKQSLSLRIKPNLTNPLSPPESIKRLEPYCSEFLIHAADNEGLQRGIDEKLVAKLAEWCSIPVTYAGGGRNLEDLEQVKQLSGGKVDLTIGSALDCFGGSGVTLAECVEWNKKQEE
jgi:phosphoribosylformimino-5-aminoimidazole carboxamide ribotide isomerase